MSFRNSALASATKLYEAVRSANSFSEEAEKMVAEVREGRTPRIRRIPLFESFEAAMQGMCSNRARKLLNGRDGDQVTGKRGSRNRRHIARAKGPDGRIHILHATKGWRLEQPE